MLIKTLTLGDCMTNCYIVSGNNSECIVIDPADHGNFIISEIQKLALTPTAILLTHGHFDHIFAIPDLMAAYANLKIYIHTDEVRYLSDESLNLAGMFGNSFVFTKEVNTVSDGDIISEAGLSFKVLHTPGHTVGSVCYITENTIFSGDTLFASTIGRTDFPLGSFDTILKSLKKLKKLDGNFDVYPGHSGSTTLDRERKYNEYLQL